MNPTLRKVLKHTKDAVNSGPWCKWEKVAVVGVAQWLVFIFIPGTPFEVVALSVAVAIVSLIVLLPRLYGLLQRAFDRRD